MSQLVSAAKSNVDRAAPGIFGFGVMEDAQQTDAVRAVIIAVADWLDEKATRIEIARDLDFRWRDNEESSDHAVDEVVRRLRAEVAVP